MQLHPDHMAADHRGADRQRRLYEIRTEHGRNWGGRYEVREIVEWGGIDGRYPYPHMEDRLNTDDHDAARRYAAILAEDAADYGAEYGREFGVWTWNDLTCQMVPPLYPATPDPTRS